MEAVDPRKFLISPRIRPLGPLDFRQDLTAPHVRTVASGRFVIASLKPDKGQVIIVKGYAFYAVQRTNVGQPTESFQLISPIVGNGFFDFSPKVDGQTPHTMGLDYNVPRIALGTLENNARQQDNGCSALSTDYFRDCQLLWDNDLHSIFVPSGHEFTVEFGILPASGVSPLPTAGMWAVGGANGAQRVDFAGACIVGAQMSEQVYNDLLAKAAKEPGL